MKTDHVWLAYKGEDPLDDFIMRIVTELEIISVLLPALVIKPIKPIVEDI